MEQKDHYTLYLNLMSIEEKIYLLHVCNFKKEWLK